MAINHVDLVRPALSGSRPGGRRIVTRFFIVAGLTVLVDQLSKLWVIGNFPLGGMGNVLFVPIWRNENFGIARGLLSTTPLWVIAGATVVLVSALAVEVIVIGRGRWTWLPSGLVVGGIVSNLADRLSRGAVTDFLRFPGTFIDGTNLADLAVMTGVAGLLVLVIFESLRG